jgi:hypothetical protein
MPHDIIRQPINPVSSPLGHFRKPFSFCLVLKRIRREVDTAAMDICFDENVYTADTIEGDFDVFVFAPVSHFGHVGAAGVVLFVACERRGWLVVKIWERREGRHTFCEDGVFVEGGG